MAVSPESPAREEEKLRAIRNGTGCFKEIVLSIDGGGVRVYSSLLILQEIHKKALELERIYERQDERASTKSRSGSHEASSSHQSLLPCHYFDYMVGASMGGLPAIMLGRLRMTTRKSITEFKKFGLSVFGRRRGVLRLFNINRYNNNLLNAAILNLLDNHLIDNNEQCRPDRLLLAQPTALQHECRTALVSVKRSQDADQAHLFRSYHSHPRKSSTLPLNATSRRPLNPGDNSPVWIHQAAKAAFGTPFLFPETEINGYRFVDGGVKMNNPSLEAFWEATKSHRHRKPPFQSGSETEAVGVIISLGSGKSKRWKTIKRFQYGHKAFANRRAIYDSLSDPESTHDQMRQHADLLEIPYLRFDVEHDMEKISMDAWNDDTLRNIEAATRQYLDLDATNADLNRAAEYIVAFRRGRQATERRIRVVQNGEGHPVDHGRSNVPHRRTANPPSQNDYITGNDSNPWGSGGPQNRYIYTLPRAHTWQQGNTPAGLQGQWPNATITEQPQGLSKPPPVIDLPNLPELPDHRQDRLEAPDSYVPTRAHTMPTIPLPAYRFS